MNNTFKPKGTPAFDYDVQVWSRAGVVQMCGHPERMREHGPCCNAARYAGQRISDVRVSVLS